MAEQLTGPPERTGERGFTLIEVLIALLVLMVGMAGILSLQLTAMKATGFSRHATEASSLAEDKVEDLRTVPLTSARFVDGSDQVDARGIADPSGLYTRTWTITPGTDTTIINVSVAWTERGNEPYTISMADMRTGTPP